MNYIDSWATAERTVFNLLVTATASTEGQNAFLGGFLPPGIYEFWIFDTGGDGGQAAAPNAAPISVRIPCDIIGLFQERATAQTWACKVLQAIPIKSIGNVQTFYIEGGIPQPLPQPIPIANSDEDALMWKIAFKAVMVFDLEKLAGETTPRAPRGLLASRGTEAAKIDLSWTASTGATTYEVWSNTTNDSATATRIASSVTATAYEDTAPTVGESMFYWVKALNASGSSGWSAPAEGWTA